MSVGLEAYLEAKAVGVVSATPAGLWAFGTAPAALAV